MVTEKKFGMIGQWLSDAADATWDSVVSLFRWLTADVAVTRWWYFLLLICLVLQVGAVVMHLLGRLRRRDYHTYVEEIFYGLRWRWKWAADNAPRAGRPYQIAAYCPKCDLPPVESERENNESGVTIIEPCLRCGECGATFPLVHPREIEERIMRNKRGMAG